MKTINEILAANTKLCRRTLSHVITKHFPDMDWEEHEAILRRERPSCGMDCDGGCPVSGRCEE